MGPGFPGSYRTSFGLISRVGMPKAKSKTSVLLGFRDLLGFSVKGLGLKVSGVRGLGFPSGLGSGCQSSLFQSVHHTNPKYR